jgi:flagellum-specific peptidoglycan hydrolase FlgJ
MATSTQTNYLTVKTNNKMALYTDRVRDYRNQLSINGSYDESDYESYNDTEESPVPELGSSALEPHKKRFINSIAADVVAACEGTGIFPSIKMAQLILETGWGTSNHARPEISNYFGIKADRSWAGPLVSSTTKEEVNGRKITVQGTGRIYPNRQAAIKAGANPSSFFRVYRSREESIHDHTAFLQTRAHYRSVFEAHTYQQQAAALQQSGYATDSQYARLLIRLIGDHRLHLLDDASINWTDNSGEDYLATENYNEDAPTPVDLEKVKEVMRRKGYDIYKRNLKLNIVGIRAKDKDSNEFNDCMVVFWNENGQSYSKQYPITTDPGVTWREDPDKNNEKKTGVAILAEGQYIEAYSLGLKDNKDALRQTGLLTVIRDNNRDRHLDLDGPVRETSSKFQIHIHRAGSNSINVNKHSAGCQVFKKSSDIDEFLRLCKRSREAGYSKFTYTLIHEKDL